MICIWNLCHWMSLVNLRLSICGFRRTLKCGWHPKRLRTTDLEIIYYICKQTGLRIELDVVAWHAVHNLVAFLHYNGWRGQRADWRTDVFWKSGRLEHAGKSHGVVCCRGTDVNNSQSAWRFRGCVRGEIESGRCWRSGQGDGARDAGRWRSRTTSKVFLEGGCGVIQIFPYRS